MSQPYWQRQTDTPLFPDIVWSRPETKHTAGKLLIIGGHAQSFSIPAAAYAAAEKAGVGTTRVILPDSLQKTVGTLFPEADFGPSNPSGGFATSALAEILSAAQWAEGVLLAGDIGRNSETTAMLEQFATKYSGQLTITRDAADYFCLQSSSLQSRPNTLLVLSMGQLQKLGVALKLPYAFTSTMGLVQLVDRLHDLAESYPRLYIMTKHQNSMIVSIQGAVSTTPARDEPIWRTTVAASAATWWVQYPTKPFEALTTSLAKHVSQ